MKVFAALFLCFTYSLLSARPSVMFSMCTFDNPAGKPYIEVYLNTAAGSIRAVPKDGGQFQGTIQVKLVVKKDNVAVFADKYNLISPVSDKQELTHDFTDLQR